MAITEEEEEKEEGTRSTYTHTPGFRKRNKCLFMLCMYVYGTLYLVSKGVHCTQYIHVERRTYPGRT